MRIRRPDDAAAVSAAGKAKKARKADVADQSQHAVTSPAVTDEPKADFPPALQGFLRAQPSYIASAYTDVEWMEIAKSIQHFQPEPHAFEKALRGLAVARDIIRCESSKQEVKLRNQQMLSHWAKAGKLAGALKSTFSWLARNGPPVLTSKDPYRRESHELTRISMMAKSAVSNIRDGDGYPKSTWKTLYHSHVLDTWTALGGKLKFSRHPRTGKIKGPLARYFSAVTQPVHGGSPESLPDIIKRHLAYKAAREKCRLDKAKPNEQPVIGKG